VLDALAHLRGLGPSRHRLALHVGNHQRPIGVVVLRKGNHGLATDHDLLRPKTSMTDVLSLRTANSPRPWKGTRTSWKFPSSAGAGVGLGHACTGPLRQPTGSGLWRRPRDDVDAAQPALRSLAVAFASSWRGRQDLCVRAGGRPRSVRPSSRSASGDHREAVVDAPKGSR